MQTWLAAVESRVEDPSFHKEVYLPPIPPLLRAGVCYFSQQDSQNEGKQAESFINEYKYCPTNLKKNKISFLIN